MADPQQEQAERDYLKPKAGEQLEEKSVTQKAMARLQVAAGAIAETKRAIPHQGNQVPSLKATNMNSMARLRVMRDDSCWEYTTDLARQLAYENPEADIAAKADLAHGGNCGEHAWVAYHYLRLHAKGEKIQVSQQKDFDHAFVLIGDLKKDKDSDIAVSDPWPNKPTACLWEDHFAHCSREMTLDHGSMVADGQSFKQAIGQCLKLSARGEQMVQAASSEAQTEQETNAEGAKRNHFWHHDDTATPKYDYKTESTQPQPQGDQQQPQVQ
jgi:hypothetical protein